MQDQDESKKGEPPRRGASLFTESQANQTKQFDAQPNIDSTANASSSQQKSNPPQPPASQKLPGGKQNNSSKAHPNQRQKHKKANNEHLQWQVKSVWSSDKDNQGCSQPSGQNTESVKADSSVSTATANGPNIDTQQSNDQHRKPRRKDHRPNQTNSDSQQHQGVPSQKTNQKFQRDQREPLDRNHGDQNNKAVVRGGRPAKKNKAEPHDNDDERHAGPSKSSLEHEDEGHRRDRERGTRRGTRGRGERPNHPDHADGHAGARPYRPQTTPLSGQRGRQGRGQRTRGGTSNPGPGRPANETYGRSSHHDVYDDTASQPDLDQSAGADQGYGRGRNRGRGGAGHRGRGGNRYQVKQPISQGVASALSALDDNVELKRNHPEKLTILKHREAKENKEKASIRYNPYDFLSRQDNLTEQCKALVESLSNGSQECIICSNPIYQRGAIWNCKQCCQPFHLGCIKRWIKKLNTNKDANQEGDADNGAVEEFEEEKVPDDDIEQAADDSLERERRRNAKLMFAFFTWTCPNCNYSYAENNLPNYKCFCGRFEEPGSNNMILPHSCGEYCDKKKHESCTHSRCNVLCHPGSCPPCSINVPVSCHCGKEQQRVPCQLAQRSKFACESECGKLLNCLSHECTSPCHDGNCQPCQIQVTLDCFCGKESRTTACGSKRQRCAKICEKTLDCGKHQCERRCHEGNCDPCPRDPQRLRYCPCGHNTIESLIGRQRRACTDPVPVCSHTCDKYLPCGLHQCQKKCHTGPCEPCKELVQQECECGKDKRQVPCYIKNYPAELAQHVDADQLYEQLKSYKCEKICNQFKKCKKHRCKNICCPARKQGADAGGQHLCLLSCNKQLSCGQHVCNDFCHMGSCKPCKVYSREPLFCPCGVAKIDPPVKCGQLPPTCQGNCKKVGKCGHKCLLSCHLGPCPPCLEPVNKTCKCGKRTTEGIYCSQNAPGCGQACGFPLRCGHVCQKVCHAKGQCFTTEEELMEKGCGQRCMKPRSGCQHRCQAGCHPGQPCPESPCEAEMRHYCKCRHRFVLTVCKSIEDRQPLECSADCLKFQRNQRLAVAFSSSKAFEQNKDLIQNEYFPEDVLEFAEQNIKFAQKVETVLTDVALQHQSKSLSGLTGPKHNFLSTYVYEHFRLDMCVYRQKPGGPAMADIIWKEGCRVPDILATEIISLVEKGIMKHNVDDRRSQVFQASLNFPSIPKGQGISDIKNMLPEFVNEYYVEKRGTTHRRAAMLHFYKFQRAQDALDLIQAGYHPFENVELICHQKQIGTNQDPIGMGGLGGETSQNQRADRFEMDDDGFTIIKKR